MILYILLKQNNIIPYASIELHNTQLLSYNKGNIMIFSVELKCSQVLTNDQDDDEKIILKIFLDKSVDIYNSRELFVFFKKIINGGIKKIIIDLKNLQYIDSMGIGVFIKVTKMLRPNKGDLVLINIPKSIEKIIGLAKVQQFLHSAETEEEANELFHV